MLLLSYCWERKGGLTPLYSQDGALGLSLEIGENRLVLGGPQQLYHLDACIPLQINSEESRAAFHRKRKVPGEVQGGLQGSGDPGGRGGGAGLLVLNLPSVSCLSSAIDGGHAPPVGALTWFLSVILSGEKRLVASLKWK